MFADLTARARMHVTHVRGSKKPALTKKPAMCYAPMCDAVAIVFDRHLVWQRLVCACAQSLHMAHYKPSFLVELSPFPFC